MYPTFDEMGPFRELIVRIMSSTWNIFIFLFHLLSPTDCATSTSKRPAIENSTVGPTTANRTTVENTSPMKPTFKGIGLRAIYVVTAVSGIVVLYFVVRAVCSRRRKNRTRRYGILNSEGRDNMEMRPLSEQDDDDDDDDMTLFDMSKRKGKR